MAEKRMFTQKIIDSDAFLDMPLSAQALYFHLNMRADDDGFVNNPKRVVKLISASEDDLKILLLKRFIIGFESGVIVIKHWRMHNTIKNDRYRPTDYQDEFALLGIKPNKAYTDDPGQLLPPGTELEPNRIQTGSTLEPQYREDLGLGTDKSRKDSDSDIEEDFNNTSYSGSDSYSGRATTPQSDVVLTLLLNDKSEYPITQADIDTWAEAFPAVDVLAELKRMKVWCIDNPAKRKTKRGIRAFVSRWLGNEQDRGGSARYSRASSRAPVRGTMDDLKELHDLFQEDEP